LNAGRSRGAATLFAVIMLAVMFTLSAALWTGVSASRRMSRNDRDSLRAMAATETGMNYLNSALARIKVRDSESAGQGVIRKWRSSMSYVNGIGSRDNDTCLVFPDIIPHPGSSQSFTATLTVIGAPDAAKPSVCMRVTGTDRASGLKRHIVANLNPLDTTDRIFRYGVASKGRVDLAKGKSNLLGSPNDAGSILSTYPNAWAIWLAGGTISGDVAVVNDPATSFINNGGTVGGTVLQVDPPDFPEFCGNQYYSSSLRQLPGNNNSGPFSNVRITSDFTFNGNDVIQGLIYVKPGVTVSFKGNPVVQGVIVVEDPGTGASSTSTLSFQGVPTFDTVVWPNDGKVSIETQRALQGYSVLGPTSYIYISGSGGGNSSKNGFAGSVVCGTLAEYGSGLVNIRDGALISMCDTAAVGGPGVSCWLEGDGVKIVRTPAYIVPEGAYTHMLSWVIDNSSYSETTEDGTP